MKHQGCHKQRLHHLYANNIELLRFKSPRLVQSSVVQVMKAITYDSAHCSVTRQWTKPAQSILSTRHHKFYGPCLCAYAPIQLNSTLIM